jgi:flagellar hook-length control protein FliK
MAVSSIEWNTSSRRTASPSAVPSRGAATAAFRLDPPAPDPRPRAADARARDDRAAAEDRNDRIAAQRANDAAATREATQARDSAKAAADARAAKADKAEANQTKVNQAEANQTKTGEARAPANAKPGAAGAEARGTSDSAGPGVPGKAQAARNDTNAAPGASAGQDTTETGTPGGTTAGGETAAADKPEESQAAAQAGTATPLMFVPTAPLPTAPPPNALASAAQGAAGASAGGAAADADPSGTAAPVVAVGTNPSGSAAQGLPGLKVKAPSDGDEGAESGEPGNGKPQGEFAAGLALTSDAARTDLTPAAPATPSAVTPATAHAKAAEASAPSAPGTPAPAPVPLGAVPMTIGLRSLAGSNQFEIRLDPKDLGRIDVNLDIDKETGAVQASLVVDRPETLALLQRDAGSLQQALNQAGLNAADGSINLSLRGDGSANGQSNGSGADGQRPDAGGSARSGAGSREPTPISAGPLRRYGAVLGIDIRI